MMRKPSIYRLVERAEQRKINTRERQAIARKLPILTLLDDIIRVINDGPPCPISSFTASKLSQTEILMGERSADTRLIATPMSEGLALDFSTSGLVYNGLHRLVMLRDGSLTYTTYPAVDRLGQSELASQKFMGADQIATYRNAIPELSQAVALLGQEQAANWPNVPA